MNIKAVRWANSRSEKAILRRGNQSMVCRPILVGWLVVVGACAPPLATARADSPSAELLRLVPDDVAFCLVVRDLRGTYAALLESPFVEKLRASRLGAALRSAPELGKL